MSAGFGVASPNLKPILPLIIARMGLMSLTTGTLNVRLTEPYFIKPDAAISAPEYNGQEVILLQRAVVSGVRTVLMRPHTHKLAETLGHGATCLELMAAVRLRDLPGIYDGAAVEVELEGDQTWWNSARSAI